MVAAVFTRICDEARRIWCYRWLVAGVAAAIFCGAAFYILHLPNTYDAWGQIFVNKQTPLATAAQGVSLVGENYGSPYLVQRTLLNDQNLEKVVGQVNSAAPPRSKAAMAVAVARLRRKILVTPDQGDGFVEVHYGDTDPVRACHVVQLVLNQFISRNVDRSRNDLDQASKFLDSQIASYEDMISASQAKLDDFRRQHPGVAFLSVAPIPLNAIMGAAPSTPVEAPISPPPAPAVATPAAPAAPSAASERIAALRARLASLRTQYTDDYPDVVSTKRQLAVALAERDREPAAASIAAAPAPSPTISTPPRPTAARPSAHRRAVPSVAPEVRAQWADLQRTDEVLRAEFQQLVSRREATRMSQAVYDADGSGKYQVTRSPVTPDLPAGPNRRLYFMLAGALAVAGGVGAGYLHAAIKGVFVSPRELEEAFLLPVVGTVSLEPAWNTSPDPRAARALTVAGGVGMAAVAAFALLLILDPTGSFVSTLQGAVQGASPIFHHLRK